MASRIQTSDEMQGRDRSWAQRPWWARDEVEPSGGGGGGPPIDPSSPEARRANDPFSAWLFDRLGGAEGTYKGIDPETGMYRYLPDGRIAPSAQHNVDRFNRRKRDRLYQDAVNSTENALGVLESWRPGGTAGIAAGAYTNRAQAISNRAAAWTSADVSHYGRQDAEKAARKASRKAGYMQLAGTAIGTIATITSAGGGGTAAAKGGPGSGPGGSNPIGTNPMNPGTRAAMGGPGSGPGSGPGRPTRIGQGQAQKPGQSGGGETGSATGGSGGGAGAEPMSQASQIQAGADLSRVALGSYLEDSDSSQFWDNILEVARGLLLSAAS